MAKQIERFQDFEERKTRRFLFFGDALYVSAHDAESHKDILFATDRALREIQVAGTVHRSDPLLLVRGSGSMTLSLNEKDPKPVIEYVKSFSDSQGKTIFDADKE